MTKPNNKDLDFSMARYTKGALVGTLALGGALGLSIAQEPAQAWATSDDISLSTDLNSESAPPQPSDNQDVVEDRSPAQGSTGTTAPSEASSDATHSSSTTQPSKEQPRSSAYSLSLHASEDSILALSSSGDQESTLILNLQVSGEETLSNNAVLVLNLDPDVRATLSVTDITTNVAYTTNASQTETVLALSRLQGGDSLGLVAHVRLQKGMNPNDLSFKLNARLTTDEGVVLAPNQSVTLTTKTLAPELRPYIGIHGNAYAGTAQDGYITQAVAVPYLYNIGPNRADAGRLASRMELRVDLPSYTNKEGERVFAQIDPSTSSEWVLSDNKQAVSFITSAPKGEAIHNYAQIIPAGSMSPGKPIQIPYLKLLFPGIKVGTSIENHAQLIVVPYDPLPGEQNLVASENSNLTLADKGNPLNISFVLKPDSTEVEDVLGARQEDQSWTATLTTFMRKDVDKLALNFVGSSDLYVSSLARSGKSDFIEHISSVEGKTAQDTWEALALTRNEEDGSVKTIDLNNSKAYSEIRIVFDPSYTLPKGFGMYSLKINTRFKDPEAISLATHPEAFEALGILSGMSTQDLDYVNQTSRASFMLAPFEYKYRFGVSKILDSTDQTLAVGDRFRIAVGVRNNVPFGQEIEGRKLALELPVGVSVAFDPPAPEAPADGSTATPKPYKGPVEYLDMSSATKGYDAYTNYRFLENYNNTGKRVLLIDLPNLAKSTLDSDPSYLSGDIFRISFVADKYLVPENPQAAYTIALPVYYTFDHTGDTQSIAVKNSLYTNATAVPDALNLTGRPESLIPEARIEFPVAVPKPLSGQSLAGIQDNSLTPYPLYLGSNSNLKLGMHLTNYSTAPQHGVVVYNALPTKTTLAETRFFAAPTEGLVNATDLVLTAPVDAPEGYEVYYLEQTPPEDVLTALQSDAWTKTPTNYDAVRALKLVALEGTVLEGNSSISTIIPVRLKEEGTGGHIYNSFSFISNEFPNPTITYATDLTLPIQYSLSTQWLNSDGTPFEGALPEGLTLPAHTSATITGRVAGTTEPISTTTIQLDAAGNWSGETALLPSIDAQGREIHYRIEAASQEGWTLSPLTLKTGMQAGPIPTSNQRLQNSQKSNQHNQKLSLKTNQELSQATNQMLVHNQRISPRLSQMANPELSPILNQILVRSPKVQINQKLSPSKTILSLKTNQELSQATNQMLVHNQRIKHNLRFNQIKKILNLKTKQTVNPELSPILNQILVRSPKVQINQKLSPSKTILSLKTSPKLSQGINQMLVRSQRLQNSQKSNQHNQILNQMLVRSLRAQLNQKSSPI